MDKRRTILAICYALFNIALIVEPIMQIFDHQILVQSFKWVNDVKIKIITTNNLGKGVVQKKKYYQFMTDLITTVFVEQPLALLGLLSIAKVTDNVSRFL